MAYLHGRTIRCVERGAARDLELGPAVDGFTLSPGVTALVPLGFKARLPAGIEAQIRPRSGVALKKGLQIPNAPGTIDSDYPDEWMVIVRNPTDIDIHIAHGERIAQMVLARYEVLPIETGEVGITTTRTGGFGSTGH